jgi:uncharacterized protein (TIGR02646 family)
MYCSGSESSQVEHYRPKAVFPDQAMTWSNFLWSCSVCNHHKRDRFPPHTEPGAQILDPSSDQVWKHFFIDEYGNLCPRWNTRANRLDARAEMTVDVLGLDRDALQTRRQTRLEELKLQVADAIRARRSDHLSAHDLRERLQGWLVAPFQPDVADYFLRGPGRTEEPFKTFLRLAKTKR